MDSDEIELIDVDLEGETLWQLDDDTSTFPDLTSLLE